MKTRLTLLLFVLFVLGCDDPSSGCDDPLYSLTLVAPDGKSMSISSETFSGDTRIGLNSNTDYTFILHASNNTEFDLIEFSIPVHQNISSRINQKIPSGATAVVFNTSNPYLNGRRYSFSALPTDPTNIEDLLVIGNTNVSVRNLNFEYWVKLRGTNSDGSDFEIDHLIPFVSE